MISSAFPPGVFPKPQHSPGPVQQGRWETERDLHTSPPTQHWGPASGLEPLPHQFSHRGVGLAIPGPAVSRRKGDEVKPQSQGFGREGLEMREEKKVEMFL